MRVTWLGHATVLLDAAGTRLLTDPVLRDRVAHLRRHAPPVAPPADVDAVLVSHAHRDHLDLPSLRALQPAPQLILLPRGAAGALRRLRPATLRELPVGATVDVGGATVTAVPAVHETRRRPFGPASEAIGYVVEDERRRVYFAGDTGVFRGMAELAPLDLALLPIWGWGASLGPGHLDPAGAVEALTLLRPAVAIPIHWGTLLPIGRARRHGHLLRDPVDAFLRDAAVRCPGVRVAVLRPGESLEV